MLLLAQGGYWGREENERGDVVERAAAGCYYVPRGGEGPRDAKQDHLLALEELRARHVLFKWVGGWVGVEGGMKGSSGPSPHPTGHTTRTVAFPSLRILKAIWSRGKGPPSAILAMACACLGVGLCLWMWVCGACGMRDGGGGVGR